MDESLVAGVMFIVLGVITVLWYKPISKGFRAVNFMSDRWAWANEMGFLIGGAAGIVMGVVFAVVGLYAN